MNKIQEAIQSFLGEQKYAQITLKAILFDMDGVLYDSMPSHAKAWHTVMLSHGLDLSYEEAYLHEGRTGSGTIQIICKKLGIELPEEKIRAIYQEKTELFSSYPEPTHMEGSYEVVQKVVQSGLMPMIVTGSGQPTLLDNLNRFFPNTFQRERMVTAFDVKHGKPHPEPYLMGLEKGNLKPWEALVVENAPLGVQAARAAGLFTIAVNTGPLPDSCLTEAGANLLFPNMHALSDAWESIREAINQSTN